MAVSSKQEVLEALRGSGTEAVTALRALPAAAFEEGRYESGWNARQILAHIAAIEWTYPRLLDLAAAPSAPAASPAGNGGGQSAAPTGGMDGYNARQVEKRSGASVAELIEEFERNRAATIAAVEAADEALFDVAIRSAGGRTGTLARVFMDVAVAHVREHVRDITGGVTPG